jgi:hypothetical protein
MIAIQPQYLTLTKLLNGRLFRIPEYQRAYSWTTHQRADPFGDIMKTHAKGEDAGHFMAAVVGLRRDKEILGTDEFHVMEIVDGQQRLTTLIILLNVIKLALNQENKAEKKLIEELSELLVKPEGDELLLLQTNHDGSQFFTNFLRKGISPTSDSGKTLADREILEAIEDCKQFVSTWVGGGNTLSELLALLKNKLFFMLHEIDDEKSVYTVFEVLNSRGLDVSWMDRLKSILMGSAFELKNANQAGVIGELHSTWRDIYSIIGLRPGMSTEALRFAATLKEAEAPSRPSRSIWRKLRSRIFATNNGKRSGRQVLPTRSSTYYPRARLPVSNDTAWVTWFSCRRSLTQNSTISIRRTRLKNTGKRGSSLRAKWQIRSRAVAGNPGL